MDETRPIGGGADPNAAAAFNSIALLSFPRTAAGPGSVGRWKLFRSGCFLGCCGAGAARVTTARVVGNWVEVESCALKLNRVCPLDGADRADAWA